MENNYQALILEKIENVWVPCSNEGWIDLTEEKYDLVDKYKNKMIDTEFYKIITRNYGFMTIKETLEDFQKINGKGC